MQTIPIKRRADEISATQSGGEPSGFAPLVGFIGSVVRCDDGGIQVTDPHGKLLVVVLSTHLPPVSVGQNVLVVTDRGGMAPALITAAWPQHALAPTRPWTYDPITAQLSIQATRLTLQADELTLISGSARLRLMADSSAELRAERIISAAVETHRIEGGSIELN